LGTTASVLTYYRPYRRTTNRRSYFSTPATDLMSKHTSDDTPYNSGNSIITALLLNSYLLILTHFVWNHSSDC
jgi:hypothetical protein